jgi:hypothetical protein
LSEGSELFGGEEVGGGFVEVFRVEEGGWFDGFFLKIEGLVLE